MKKYAISILMGAAAMTSVHCGAAQEPLAYDSLKNLPAVENLVSLQGQTIYFDNGLYGDYKQVFYTEPTFATSSRTASQNIYSPIPGRPASTLKDAIDNKYFLIKEISPADDLTAFCFTLEEVNKDNSPKNGAVPFYMAYHPTSTEKPRFITMGYVDKLKRELVGKDYIWTGRNYLRSLSDGMEYEIPEATVFRCKGVAIADGTVQAIMSNPQYGEFIGDLEQVPGQIFCFQSNQAYREWIKTYGLMTAKKMLVGDLTPGMTKKMAELSWGTPSSKESIPGKGGKEEKWSYDTSERALYFEGDKLVKVEGGEESD